MRPIHKITLLFLIASLTFGCTHTQDPFVAHAQKVYGTANDYFPASVGSSWTYKISPAPVEQNIESVTMLKVLSGNRYQDSKGNIFQVRTSGIHDGIRYLIKMPLSVGHRWMAVPSASVVERYELVAKDLTIAVPAGIFNSCLKVRGEVDIKKTAASKASRMMMEWIYAPGVGMIQLTQYVYMEMNSEPRRTAQYQLLKYQIAGQNVPQDSP